MADRQRSDGSGEDNTHKHELERFLEAVVVNCQHIAAISKGLCVKGVSHDVSLSELSKHEELADSSSIKILKDEYLRSKKTLADIVIKLSDLKEKYLAEYNKGNEKMAAASASVVDSTGETPPPVVDTPEVPVDTPPVEPTS